MLFSIYQKIDDYILLIIHKTVEHIRNALISSKKYMDYYITNNH